MKLLVLFLLLAGLVVAADVEGNFTLRFEPTAKLQAGTEVPFAVHATDDRGKPLLRDDKVELSIAPENQDTEKTLRAWFVGPGEFIAKPEFPSEGQWTVTVTARRQNKVSTRSITFAVAP